jgi:hypothetical protein
MGVKVRVKKDVTGLDAVFRKMQALGSLSLTVGVQGAKGAAVVVPVSNAVRAARTGTRRSTRTPRLSAGRINMATIALFNEFGTRGIPQRSFLRGALFENKDKIAAKIAEVMERYIARPQMDALTALSQIGKFVASLVKTRINTTSHWARSNAPSTVAAKGFDRPLHNTDRLSKSISWAVRGPGGSIISEGAAR